MRAKSDNDIHSFFQEIITEPLKHARHHFIARLNYRNHFLTGCPTSCFSLLPRIRNLSFTHSSKSTLFMVQIWLVKLLWASHFSQDKSKKSTRPVSWSMRWCFYPTSWLHFHLALNSSPKPASAGHPKTFLPLDSRTRLVTEGPVILIHYVSIQVSILQGNFHWPRWGHSPTRHCLATLNKGALSGNNSISTLLSPLGHCKSVRDKDDRQFVHPSNQHISLRQKKYSVWLLNERRKRINKALVKHAWEVPGITGVSPFRYGE